ncbi:damage-inducible mutagenesis protein [Bradyrhizobium prioriisuperbiae]|uniref:ImuA family protein n=1 Tax=Bradyrhizobium prioriisuperbiae TaxID=2854389 RepID=UPI0028EBA5AF|nr:damage-inducible mutagenesis protein [Bradyrhizobium prioritasuperba]
MPPPLTASPALLAELRQTMERVSSKRRRREVLPFGIASVDVALPSGGLALGAVHEISESGVRGAQAAVAPLFAAGILARIGGPVLWCLHSRDLFAPALARVGLHPDRVIYCETWKDSQILPAMEDGLRHRGLAGVVGELVRLPLTPSRRLQLAAEDSGVVALVIRRSSQHLEETNAAFSRWRVSPSPSAANQPLELGRARWNVELLRCRGAEPHSWLLEACNAKGRLSVPADVRDGSRPAEEQERASA